MTQDLVAVLDACVLVPMPLADTLLRLAAGPRLYVPKWTDQIMAEVSRTLIEKFGIPEESAAYRQREIRKHFGEAWVGGYEELIPVMRNEPKDRHVLAAAVRCGAGVIVTYDRKDFPRMATEPYSIEVQGPSTFLTDLYAADKESVLRTIEEQAEDIGQTRKFVLERLRVNVPAFVRVLEDKDKAAGSGR